MFPSMTSGRPAMVIRSLETVIRTLATVAGKAVAVTAEQPAAGEHRGNNRNSAPAGTPTPLPRTWPVNHRPPGPHLFSKKHCFLPILVKKTINFAILAPMNRISAMKTPKPLPTGPVVTTGLISGIRHNRKQTVTESFMKKAIILSLSILLAGTTKSLAQPFAAFQESANGNIRPTGWVAEFLNRQRNGLSGHPGAMSFPYNSCLWAGDIVRKNDTKNAPGWWCYEQTAYYSDGILRLGYLLNDKPLLDKAEAGIKYTLAHAAPNGRLGNAKIASLWPMCVYFRVLKAQYERTGDPAIVKALEGHYLSMNTKLVNDGGRHIISLEGMLWVYGKTKNPVLLQMAEDAFDMGGFKLDAKALRSKEMIKEHGVTYAEELKLPLLLYAYTGKQKYLDLALNGADNLERWHLLPDGVPSSAEYTLGKDVDNSHETCDITDFTWTWGYYLAVTGQAKWADRIERAVFNAGLGCITKDFKALQYFSSVNQVIATGTSNNNNFMRGRTWMAYRPFHQTECCAGNVHRYMPNFAWRSWMRGKAGAVVATLYAPSAVSVDVNGTTVDIEETTNYPFEGTINFTFKTRKSVEMPFMFRVPEWATSATVTVNGKQVKGDFRPATFATLKRKFRNGDRITLDFGMKTEIVTLPRQGLFVQRGPLLFTHAIKQHKEEDTHVYPYIHGKTSDDPSFKCWNLTPASPFNYGVDPALLPADGKLEAIIDKEKMGKGYPFDMADNPITVKLPVRRINWEIEGGMLNPELPAENEVVAQDATEVIELVPYGCTELRLTVFPKAPKTHIK